MEKQKATLIIVVILWLSVAISLIRVFSFDIEFFLGIIFLSIVTATLVIDRFSNATFPLLLLFTFLSVFNVIKFCYCFTFVMRIGFLQINVASFLIFFVLVFWKRNDIFNLREEWFSSEPDEIAQAQDRKIALFKREFESLPSEELIRRRNSGKLVEAANVAIENILAERNN